MTRRDWLPAAACAGLALAQNADETYQVYSEHPRLLLRAQRLRLLRRERERRSSRFQQFETLVKGNARMAEPGFAWALYYQVAGDEAVGKRAIEWALGAQDLRQIAIVLDWCEPLMAPAQTKQLSSKAAAFAAPSYAPFDIKTARDRVFAALASAESNPKAAADFLKRIVEEWWRGRVAKELQAGKRILARDEVYPLFELLHAIRDAYEIELRENAGRFFRDLPAEQLLSYYPPVFPAAENEFRIPAYIASGDPDLRLAALSRAAELAMVAYDSTATESQFLQGWLLHDRFALNGVFGAPYEFLWANPYQPGLAYHHMPLRFHDPASGRLMVRSSWDDDATWLGYLGREIQLFEKGTRRAVKAQREALILGETAVLPRAARFEVQREGPRHYFLTGLRPGMRYVFETDDEELVEHKADAGGIVAAQFTRLDGQTVRVAEFG